MLIERVDNFPLNFSIKGAWYIWIYNNNSTEESNKETKLHNTQTMVDATPVNALALLKEEMSSEEIHLKVNAIHRLKTVILSIGAPETVQ